MEFQILDAIQQIHTPLLDRIMIWITNLGTAGILWIIMTVILLLIPKTRRVGLVLTMALVLDLILCNCFLKPLIARTRPYDVNTAIKLLVPRQVDYSFPSGHTAASFAVVTVLFLERQKLLGRLALLVAILIAFSRMYLYVHYPTDILGGVILGVLCGYCAHRIVKQP